MVEKFRLSSCLICLSEMAGKSQELIGGKECDSLVYQIRPTSHEQTFSKMRIYAFWPFVPQTKYQAVEINVL